MAYNSSYQKYRLYRKNRRCYAVSVSAFPCFVGLLVLVPLVEMIWWLVVGGLVLVGIYVLWGVFRDRKKEVMISKCDMNKKEVTEVVCNEEKIGTGEERLSMGTTEIGYINKNNQKHLGRTNEAGTDHMQWFYNMECGNCGHTYKANGSDIWQRKCPRCQGGRA